MKRLIINLQTQLWLDERNNILASYNLNKSMLVINKPICTKNDVVEIVSKLEKADLKVAKIFETDSFGITFYDPISGGTSTFHEVEDQAKNFSLANY